MGDFVVENPADVPMLMQLLPLSLYPNPQTIVDMLTPRLASDLSDYIEMDDLEVFTLQDLETYSVSIQTISNMKNLESPLYYLWDLIEICIVTDHQVLIVY